MPNFLDARKIATEIVRDDGRSATLLWTWSEQEQCAYVLEAWDTETGHHLPVTALSNAEMDRFSDHILNIHPADFARLTGTGSTE